MGAQLLCFRVARIKETDVHFRLCTRCSILQSAPAVQPEPEEEVWKCTPNAHCQSAILDWTGDNLEGVLF